ncbi:hypothetical protein PRZ48_001917 [Zasmidium cellare]|uniref:Fibroin-3 related protein n=1 Tax=Zasmidium cellare TaxID=395010 RepID=A0ABR0F2J9_ZASCE|nr:hypothetical protein PRZ48_001917 [Zasmidium cellare]
MATLHWQRDIGSDIAGVKNTFSGWDQCMAKAYCKWPVIIGIIIGSLIVLSIVWCIARCLCCGAECCCGCLSCCNACCPSPRGSKNHGGYQQAPPTPSPFYNQYQPPPGPVYASGAIGGYRSGNVAQTATFDTPSKNGRYNEDALPAMPSWDTAASRREEVMEMEKLNQQQNGHTNGAGDGTLYQNPEPTPAYGYQQGQCAQQESLLPQQQEAGRFYGAGQRSPVARQDFAHEGDMGGMTANPYSDYQPQRQQQFSPGPYGVQNHTAPSPYSPVSPAAPYNPGTNTYGAGAGAGHSQQQRGYEASIPPSYHTRPPSDIVSPISPPPQASYPGQASYQPYGGGSGVGRKPVQGSWREV